MSSLYNRRQHLADWLDAVLADAGGQSRWKVPKLEQPKSQSMPMGVVIRRLPGVTRWAKWVWKPVSVLPGAGPAEWQILREEDGAVEYHAATVPLELFRTDTEAYLTALSERMPSLYVVLRQSETPRHPMEVLLVTASP